MLEEHSCKQQVILAAISSTFVFYFLNYYEEFGAEQPHLDSPSSGPPGKLTLRAQH